MLLCVRFLIRLLLILQIYVYSFFFSSEIIYCTDERFIIFLTGVAVSGFTACVCGSLAALVAETVCTPLDVVRTRIMCIEKEKKIQDEGKRSAASSTKNNSENENRNPFVMYRKIVTNEGVASLYKGSRTNLKFDNFELFLKEISLCCFINYFHLVCDLSYYC